MMKRAGYREAIYWIAWNDDIEWLADAQPIKSVTACLVQDLFDVADEKLFKDLRRAVLKRDNDKGIFGPAAGKIEKSAAHHQ